MPYDTPGVYIEEISGARSVVELPTAIPAFVGCTEKAPDRETGAPSVRRINSLTDYEALFGGPKLSSFDVTFDARLKLESVERTVKYDYLLYYALDLYFKNGGGSCYVVPIGGYNQLPTRESFKAGLDALEGLDEPTLIVLTDAVDLGADDYCELARYALAQCSRRRDRFAVLDVVLKGVSDPIESFRTRIGAEGLAYGAAYYPYLQTTFPYAFEEFRIQGEMPSLSSARMPRVSGKPNASVIRQIKATLARRHVVLPPSAAIAGVYARVDRERGVWKAPANVGLLEVSAPTIEVGSQEQERLSIDQSGISINAIRAIPGRGVTVWGARTLAAADPEWRYIPVRRLCMMIEESTRKAAAFVVFEPNNAATWVRTKTMIENYLTLLWSRGALAGARPDQAFFVKVGLGSTMTQLDVLEGRMIVEMGIAAVRPGEFIILRFMHNLQHA